VVDFVRIKKSRTFFEHYFYVDSVVKGMQLRRKNKMKNQIHQHVESSISTKYFPLRKYKPGVNPTKLEFFVFPIFTFKLGHFKVQTIFLYGTNNQA
jgi:hypothetical protein